MKRLKRALGVAALVSLALVAGAAGLGAYAVRRPFPQLAGQLQVPGLSQPVAVYRDAYGVPHIYASSVNDLFMAQGYVHAQDRFYQMDFWRHQTAGRLSELYGSSTLAPDRFLRTLGWHRIAEQEYAAVDDHSRLVLDAYARGVNAYLAGRSAADLGLEYSLLGLIGLRGYVPEPWSPVSSLAWAKAMAWNLGGNMDEEIMRADLIAQIRLERTLEYLPLYPADRPIVVPDAAVAHLRLGQLQAQLADVSAVTGERFDGIGSNNWVVAGSRSDTGRAMLANDPHLAIQMPALWYQVGLHCQPLSTDCPYDVAGFSFAGAPGVIIGHNSRIAWGFTNAGPDVQDLFIERLNPNNPDQYEVDGQWVDMTIVHDTLRLRDGSSEPLVIRATRHGPIITDVYGLDDFTERTGIDGGPYALSLRWTALDPGFTYRAILGLNRAANFDDFRQALRDFVAPAQNIVYADVDGNIGYQLPGHIPIRRSGDGLLPVPGWNDEQAWTGFIPFDELPWAYNPPQGYIMTANNAIVGPDYPYLISLSWDSGYRAQRLVDLIEAQPVMSMAYMQQMQADNMNLGSQEVLPYLLALSFEDARLSAALDRLRTWDYQMEADSQPAALYISFFNALLAATFHDDLPEAYWPSGNARHWLALRGLLAQPDSPWWDIAGVTGTQTRDDILRQAWAEGYADLEARLGRNPERWTWGALHTATFTNETLGRSGIRPVEMLFNRGPFQTSGGTSIVNANSFHLAADDRAPGANPYAVRALPALRMLIDMGDFDGALAIHTTGQSGHAFHRHYIDMAEPWSRVEYHRMLWSRAEVESQARSLLTLTP
jgi:penicillin G amidase